MKYRICLLFVVIVCSHATAQTNFALGSLDSISSTLLKEQRALLIWTPYTGKKTNRTTTATYPVLYVLDGENQFHFISAMVERMIGAGTIPPMIVVGIPNTNRGHDLTPTALLTGDDAIPGSGGGENFMAFIEKELMPYVAANYPVSAYRILMGHSLGGLMVIHTLVHNPDLFDAYISMDGAIWWDDHKVLLQAKQELGKTKYKNKTLFIAMANRMENGMDTAAVQSDTSSNTELIRYNLDLVHFIKQHPENKLRFKHAYFENETHGTVSFIAAYNALKFIFDYYAFPIDKVHKVTNPALITVITEHYQSISKNLGYHVLPDAAMVNNLGYRAMNGRFFETARQLFALNVLNYPGNANAWDSYGDYYNAVGDKRNAIISFKKSLSIAEIPGTSVKLNALIKTADAITKIDALIEKAVGINRFNGTVLVSKGGSILYEKAYGYQDAGKKLPNTLQTIYQVGSTTKEFTAAVILQLAEQGKLSLDDKLTKYFPAYPRGNEITIKHLLTHTSGIYEILRDHTAVMENTAPRSKERMLSFFTNKPLDFEPGTQYAYCNSGYILLGLIIEKITGQTYQQAVRKNILEPLQMHHTGFDFIGLASKDRATGYDKYTKTIQEPTPSWDSTATYAAGSLYSSVDDLYRWHKGLSEYRVYSEASMYAATTPFLKGYGLGCWIDSLYNKKIVSHGGNIQGFTSYFGRIQEDDVSVIILNNIYNHQIETIGQSIIAILYDQPYSYFDEIDLPVAELDKYIGDYEVNANYKVKISRVKDKLYIQRNNRETAPLYAYREHTFFQKDDDIRVSFQADNGIINRISITEGLNTKKGDKMGIR